MIHSLYNCNDPQYNWHDPCHFSILTLLVSLDCYRALFFERYNKAIWASDNSQRNPAYLPPLPRPLTRLICYFFCSDFPKATNSIQSMIGAIDKNLGNQISCGGNPPAGDSVIGCDCEVRLPQMASITHTRSRQGTFHHFSRLSMTLPPKPSVPGSPGW